MDIVDHPLYYREKRIFRKIKYVPDLERVKTNEEFMNTQNKRQQLYNSWQQKKHTSKLRLRRYEQPEYN